MECLYILQSLKEHDESTLREAIFAAGEYKCKEAIPVLVELLQSDNIGLQEAAEISLRKIDGPETVEALVPLLSHKDPSVRNIVIDILKDIGDQNLDSLIALLDSEDRDIRIFVADILGSIKSVIVVMPLCNLLLNDPDVNVRQQAAVSLGNIGHPEAIKCLKRALNDEEWVQFSVIEAFKKIKDPSSAKYLLDFLGKGSEMIDSMIIDTLGEIGTVKVVPVLFNKLKEYSSYFLRLKVVEAIVKILKEQIKFTFSEEEKKEFLNYLREALQDEDEEIQNIAIKGLGYLGLPEASKDIFQKLLEVDESADPERYDMIKDSLLRLGFNEYLKEEALNEDEEIALKAIDILTEFKDPNVKEFLKSIFWKKGRDVQRKISNYVFLVGDERDKEFFVDVLKKHMDGTVIKNGLAFMGKIKAVDCDELVASFLEHPFPDVREKALEICVILKTNKIVDRLIKLTQQQDLTKKITGIVGLGRLGDIKYEKYISLGLKDKDPEVRKVAVEAISNLYKDDFLTLLSKITPYLKDESKDVRLKTLEILYKLSNSNKDKILSFVEEALDDEDKWIRIKALEILGDIKEGINVDKVISLLRDKDKLVQIKAIETLGKIGGHKSVQALLNFIKDIKDFELIDIAEKVLEKM